MTDQRHPELIWVSDFDDVQIGPLHDLSDMYIEKKLGNEEVLYFQMRKSDPKSSWVLSDRPIRYKDVAYRIGPIDEGREGEGAGALMTVQCPALWYDLVDDVKYGLFSILNKTTEQGITAILLGTGWTVGTVAGDLDATHSYELTNSTALQLLRGWAIVSGLEIEFDTVAKTVNFVEAVGSAKGVGFRYGRNIESIHKKYEPPLATRLWPVGANDLSISGVNITGLPYVENYDWYIEQGLALEEAQARYLKGYIWEDDRYLLALSLYDAGIAKLAEMSRPTISYELTAMDLSFFTGVAEDDFTVGDVVLVTDEELDLNISVRIVRTVVKPYEPWNNTIELSYYRPGIGVDSFSSSSSGSSGADFKMLVDEGTTNTVTSSTTYLCELNVTVAGLSNGIIGAHLAGFTTGSGTMRVEILIDGVRLGGYEEKTFTSGQRVQFGIPTWYAALEEGDHTISLVARVSTGAGTVLVQEFESRLYAMVSGALGGIGGSGPAHVTVGDDVPDATIAITHTHTSSLKTDDVALELETVPGTVSTPTHTVTVLIV